MCFKKLISALLLLSLSACSDFLRGPKWESENLNIPSGPLVCLQKLPDNFAKIGKGQAQASEVDTDFKCLEGALLYFKDRTVGTYKDGYTAEDFRRFFGKYFLTENNISKTFADELVLLKSAVLGGKQDIVSKEEVAKLSHYIGALRKELIPLLPSLHVLLLEAKTADQGQISTAIAAFKKAGQALMKESLLYKSDYTFEDLHRLVVETSSFVGIQTNSQINTDFKKYWPLVGSLKKVLLGERATLKSLEDWMNALHSFADIYDLALRKHYLLKDFKFNSASDVDKVGELLDKVLYVLHHSHQIKNYNFIPCRQVDELIDDLYEAQIINFEVTPATLKKTYRTILGRMSLGVGFKSANEVLNVTQEHLHFIRRELSVWRNLQTWINGLTSDPSKTLLWSEVRDSFEQYRIQPSQIEELQYAALQFKKILNQKRPIKFNLKGRLILQYDMNLGGVTWTSLSLSNMTYMFTRMMLRGYSVTNSSSQSGVLSERELIRWYDDFKDIGLEMKAFDPRQGQTNSGSRSAKEANFFMISSNGDKEIDSSELYEYISMLFSAGVKSVEAFRKLAEKENSFDKGSKDLFGLPYIKEKEFKMAVTKNRHQLLSHLPRLVEYFNQFPDRWSLFYDKLVAAARISPPQSGRLDHGDLRVIVMMIHYQESLLLSFDANRDGALSVPEIEAAAPRFLGFLKEITEIPIFLKSVDEWLLRHGFVYLVINGHRPSGPDWIQYVWERMTNPMLGTEVRVDRVGVIQVFRNLKDELKNPLDSGLIGQ